MKIKAGEIITYIGLLLIVAGIILPLWQGPQSSAFRYVYSAGALLTVIGRLMTPYRGPYLRVKRLVRLEFWSAIFFVVSAYFMWTSINPKDWIVFTLAGGAIQCYVSIMLPIVQKKCAKG